LEDRAYSHGEFESIDFRSFVLACNAKRLIRQDDLLSNPVEEYGANEEGEGKRDFHCRSVRVGFFTAKAHG
jgi:hypothetical protein